MCREACGFPNGDTLVGVIIFLTLGNVYVMYLDMNLIFYVVSLNSYLNMLLVGINMATLWNLH